MDAVTGNLDAYWEGMRSTAGLTVLSFFFALLVGTVAASFRVSPVPPLRFLGALYVELFRNTPLLVLMYLFYFGLPKVGIRFSEFNTAIMALSLYTGAFVTETVRAGINSVAVGQAEAARSLGLTFRQTMAEVVVPQALRTVVAPLGSLFIALIKNSAVAFTISVAELTGELETLISETGQAAPLLLGGVAAYLMLTIPAGAAVTALERKVAVKR